MTQKDLVLSIKIWVVLLLLMPLVVTNGTLFPFVVGKALFARAIIEIVFGLWLILAFLHPSYRPRRSWLLMAFAIYLAVSLLAGLTGASLTRSLWSNYARMQGIVDLAHWFLLTLVLVAVFRSMTDWIFLFSANLGVSLVVGLLGAAQFFDFEFLPFFEYLRAAPRVTITLGNSTFVGGYTLVNVFIGLALLAHSFSVQTSKNTRYIVLLRLYWLLAVAMNCWMLFLSGTRGALIGLVAGGIVLLVCYVVLERSRRLKVALLGLTALLVIAPSALFLVGQTTTMDRITFSNVLTQRAARTALAEGSVRNRLACFTAGVEGFVARPILGWGPENFVVAFGRYFNGDPKVTGICDQAHNKLVEELATRGIVGFLSYSAIWAAMFLVLIRTLRRQREGPWRFTVFIAGALVGYFVHNLFLFDTPATFLQLVLLLAFVVSLEMAHRASGGQEDSNASPVAGCSCTGKSRIPGWAQKAINCVIFGPRWRTAFMMVAVMGLVASSIYFLNYRPYRAATATAGVIDPSITWSQRLDKFDQSVNLFPHLANNPRQILFTMLASNWTLLPEREAERALAMVEIESRRALDAEPQGWQIHAALARFYQSVSIENPAGNLDLARSYADGANQLAPKTYLVSRVLARQQSVELNQGMVVADPQGPFSAVLVVPVFLLIGVDELIYAWPRISDKQAAGVR